MNSTTQTIGKSHVDNLETASYFASVIPKIKTESITLANHYSGFISIINNRQNIAELHQYYGKNICFHK